MSLTLLRKGVRSVASRVGVTMLSTRNVPFGFDYLLDIDRLNQEMRLTTRMFFDVGANDGTLTVSARKVFPDAVFHCFEPHPRTVSVLTSNVGAFANVSIHAVALSDDFGAAPLYDYGLDKLHSLTVRSRYAQPLTGPRAYVGVARETVDRFCAHHGIEYIDVLKIDTEGHELAVLRGATRMLTEGRVRFVYAEYECLRQEATTDGTALEGLGGFLEPAGYRFIASYTEQVHLHSPDVSLVANALFMRGPST